MNKEEALYILETDKCKLEFHILTQEFHATMRKIDGMPNNAKLRQILLEIDRKAVEMQKQINEFVKKLVSA